MAPVAIVRGNGLLGAMCLAEGPSALTMRSVAIHIDDKSVRARVSRLQQNKLSGLGVRVRLEALDRHESATAVHRAMEAVTSDQQWWTYPTTNGTLLGLSERTTAPETLAELASRLEADGHSGTIAGASDSWFQLGAQATGARPIACSTTLALTMDTPYQDGPRNQWGNVKRVWGVPQDATRQRARDWVDWVVPEQGRAVVVQALADVTREDALDVLLPQIERVWVEAQLLGSPEGTTRTRSVRVRPFGEVTLTDTGSGKDRVTQAREMLNDLVLSRAADLDYATVRVNRASADFWTASQPQATLWLGNRHLWSSYVADPNPIQVLTDAHLDKAHDLSQRWDVTPITEGRWLVQAKDLTPWFNDINELHAERGWQYLDQDLLEQARYDFGDMILTQEVAAAQPWTSLRHEPPERRRPRHRRRVVRVAAQECT